MMRLSTKGRYSTRLMLELALHYGEDPVLLKNIAKRQEISEGYLVHLLPSLKAAGMINSARGSHGGYTLARDPSQIKLSEVVQAVEGPLAPVECVNTPNVCPRVSRCVTREIWQEMGKRMVETLDGITLQDMVVRHKEKESGVSVPVYSI